MSPSSGRRCGWTKTRGKGQIIKRDRMVMKLKGQFKTVDYKLEMLKNLQNLSQWEKTKKEETGEFQKMAILIGHGEVGREKVTSYTNGIRTNIQEELSLVQIIKIIMQCLYKLLFCFAFTRVSFRNIVLSILTYNNIDDHYGGSLPRS